MDQVSNSSLSAIELVEEPSIRSNDATLVAVKALGWRGFDASKAAPDDVQTQAAMRLRGKLRSKELAQLRQLVEGDERFARLLDRHCKAIHELIVLGNPAPVLAVLAGLVWSSLSIAWELDTSHMPKARMKNEIDQLKVKLQKVLDDFSESRTCYLKEIVAQREKLRRFDGLQVQEVERLVYEEEPVMFYEPIKYLDERTKGHVAQIIEEKLKLLLKRLEMGDAPIDWNTFMTAGEEVSGNVSPRSPKFTQRCKTESAKDEVEFGRKAEQAVRRECERAAAEELRKAQASFNAQLEELRASKKALEGEMTQRLEESEARHAKTQMMVSEYKAQHLQAQAELSSIGSSIQTAFQELAQLPGGSSPPELPDQASGLALQQLLRMEGEVRTALQKKLTEAESRSRLSSETSEAKAPLESAAGEEGATVTGFLGARANREASKSSLRLGSKEALVQNCSYTHTLDKVAKAATVDKGEGPSRAGSKAPAITAEKAVGTASRAGSKAVTTSDKAEGPASRAGSKAPVITADKAEGPASRAGSKVPIATADRAEGPASRASSKAEGPASHASSNASIQARLAQMLPSASTDGMEGTASRTGSKVATFTDAPSRASSKVSGDVELSGPTASRTLQARGDLAESWSAEEAARSAAGLEAKHTIEVEGTCSKCQSSMVAGASFCYCCGQKAGQVEEARASASSASAFVTEAADDAMVLQTEEIISAAASASLSAPCGVTSGPQKAAQAHKPPRDPVSALPNSRSAASAIVESEAFVMEEVGRLGAENRSLRSEVQSLHEALGELTAHIKQLESSPGSRPKSSYGSAAARALNFPFRGLKAGKVHERLYLEFFDRQERKRALQESVQQARENEVLDIFKSQHPWLNALSKHGEALSFLSAFTEGFSSEEDKIIEASELWRTHAEVESAWREQLEKRFTRPSSTPQRQVPSPRSPGSPSANSPSEAATSPHLAGNFYPLLISRLAGDAEPGYPSSERPSPSSSNRAGTNTKLQRPKSSGALSSSSRTGRKPSPGLVPVSQELGGRQIREGLRLLATKPGEASAARSSSTTALMRRPSVRCLL